MTSTAGPTADPGRLIYAVRPTPRLTPWLIMIGILVVPGAFIYLTNDHSVVLTATGVMTIGVFLSALALSGFLELHRIHEHAVVVGLSRPRRSPPYVIPLSSIDPSTVTVHHRANMIARRLGTQGSPTMRMAVYSTRAVSFVGRSWQAANLALDPGDPASAKKLRRLQLRQAFFGKTALPEGASVLWALGVRRPEPLVKALEEAFAADGNPQPGLAERALRNPIIEPAGKPFR